jgi:hypothetical protein
MNGFFNSEMSVVADVTATWSDSGAGILGGIRNGRARGAGGLGDYSMIAINSYLSVNSSADGRLSELSLTYNFAPIDLTNYPLLVLEGLSMDESAKQGVVFTLRLIDSQGSSATATLPLADLVNGRNVYNLSGSSNWDKLNRSSIATAQMTFTGSLNAIDYGLESVAFSRDLP